MAHQRPLVHAVLQFSLLLLRTLLAGLLLLTPLLLLYLLLTRNLLLLLQLLLAPGVAFRNRLTRGLLLDNYQLLVLPARRRRSLCCRPAIALRLRSRRGGSCRVAVLAVRQGPPVRHSGFGAAEAPLDVHWRWQGGAGWAWGRG